jgi:hypothetical protein
MSNDTIEQLIAAKGLTGFKSLPISQNSTAFISMYNFVWEPGRSVVSHCDQCGNTPKQTCGCGIYAHRELEKHIYSGYANPEHAIVELSLWGIVHMFTEGYRAQYAKIVKIYIPRAGEAIPLATRRDALELSYMVPVEYIDLPTWRNENGVSAPVYTPRQKPITIEDLELFVNSEEESIRDFCRKELKKKYAQKIASSKKRLQYGKNIIEQAEKDLLLFETKRAAIPR